VEIDNGVDLLDELATARNLEAAQQLRLHASGTPVIRDNRIG